jgi:subtilisin family serine protease
MELESLDVDFQLAETPLHKAILQFENELTSEQILFAESVGIVLPRRGSSVIHLGTIYSALIPDTMSLEMLSEIGLTAATSGTKKFYPSLSSSVPAIGAPDVWENLKKDGLSINGTGTRVAVLDTGIHLLHPSFWRNTGGPLNVLEDSGSYYVDLNSNSLVDVGEGPIAAVDGLTAPNFVYSNDYMFIDVGSDGTFDYAEGDRWLGGIDANQNDVYSLIDEDIVVLDESKVAILYDQENNAVYTRGVNLTQAFSVIDHLGHGTHVASIIAGGQPGFTSYVGVAPGADLIIIKSPLDSFWVLDGILFAAENDADVINMSFSSYLAYLDGSDFEDMAISEAFRTSGMISSLAAGNLGDEPKHARFQVGSGSFASANLAVSSPPSYSFVNILWRSEDNDEHVILEPPSDGMPVDLGEFSEIVGTGYSLESSNISANVFPDTSLRGLNRLIIQVSDGEHFWNSGTWGITLTNPTGNPIWVDAYAWDNSWTGNSLRFSSSVDYTHTISSPGTADLGIAVASYSDVSESLSSSSSKGPRVDGVPKPAVTAPGVGIRAAQAGLSNLWTTRSGTSMAAPHVAGVLALIRQATGDTNSWKDVSVLYDGAGGYNNHYSPSNDNWGHGIVNPVMSVQQSLGVDAQNVYWDSIEMLIPETANASINGSLDVLGVKVVQNPESLGISVDMRLAPDFTGNNILTIEWDTDENLVTGSSGIDLIANVTDNAATVYEWVGSAFQVSAITADWWVDSTSIVVSIDRPIQSLRGRVAVGTGNETLYYADHTTLEILTNQWRPILEALTIEVTGDVFNFSSTIADNDNSVNDLSFGWNLVDGGLNSFESDIVEGSESVNFQINISEVDSPYLLSLMLNVSDGETLLFLPPILLLTDSGIEVQIVSASLDQTSVRVGPFISEMITGEVIVSGYLSIRNVKLSLQSELGFMLNLTLDGSEGVYPIRLSPSNLPAGNYVVFVSVTTTIGSIIDRNMGTLSIVLDNSGLIIPVIVVSAIIGVIILVSVRNRLKAPQNKEELS